MIYCPNCGTANKDGSKFCNQCGQPFAGTSRSICPTCGAPNPIENLFCDACGSKLVPLVTKGGEQTTGVKGLSLPTKSSGSRLDPHEEGKASMTPEDRYDPEQDNDDARDWPGADGESERDAEPVEEGDIPDWMREIGLMAKAQADAAGDTEVEEAAADDEHADEEEASEPAEEPPEEGEVPDWMREIGLMARAEADAAESGDQAEGQPAEPAEEEPSTERVEEGAEPSEEAFLLEEGEIPDWMRDLGISVSAELDWAEAQGQETAEPHHEGPALDEGEAEIPEWMEELGESEEPEAEWSEAQLAAEREAPVSEAEEETEGDWLTELRASLSEEEEEQPEELPEEPEEEEAAEWLQRLDQAGDSDSEEPPTEGFEAAPESEEEPPQEQGAEQPSGEEAIPEEAAAMAAPEGEAEQPPAEEPSATEAPTEESAAELVLEEAAEEELEPEEREALGAWLQGEGPVILDLGEEEEEEPVLFTPEKHELEPLEFAEVPPWLEDLAPEGAVLTEELGPDFGVAGMRTPEEAGLERAEIPEWLEELRPGRPKPETEVEEPAVESGFLQGIRGPLYRTEAIDPTPASQVLPASEPTSTASSQAELLTNLLAEPVAALVKPKRVPVAPSRERGLPGLATLLILVAVLIPFFVSGIVPGGSTVAVPQSVAGLAGAVQGLGPGDTVLVSFDYDPGISTELDRAAQPVLDDLSSRGVNFLVMGVSPTGVGLATQMGLPSRTVYLGYLPGQDMGLRRLASDFANVFPVDFFGQRLTAPPFGVTSLRDVALIVTIAPSQNVLRWWMEQVATQVDTPIGAVVSAGIEPSALPYYASHQLVGMVSGWVGGQAYLELSNPAVQDPADTTAIEAQSLAHLAIAGLIVLSNIIYLANRLFGGKK